MGMKYPGWLERCGGSDGERSRPGCGLARPRAVLGRIRALQTVGWSGRLASTARARLVAPSSSIPTASFRCGAPRRCRQGPWGWPWCGRTCPVGADAGGMRRRAGPDCPSPDTLARFRPVWHPSGRATKEMTFVRIRACCPATGWRARQPAHRSARIQPWSGTASSTVRASLCAPPGPLPSRWFGAHRSRP